MTNNKVIIGTLVVLGVAGLFAVMSLQYQVSELENQNEDILNKLNQVLEQDSQVINADVSQTFNEMFLNMRGGIITQTCGFEGEEDC